ncbi:MAG: hypothetical protein WCA35_18275 [Kovacikia sp.]
MKLSLPNKPLSEANLKLQVKPNDTMGTYEIVGSANLPDQSRIQVAAVRYLQLSSQAARDLNPKPTYAILAYQTVVVKQGKWETLLNLWKIAPDGQFQENWQLDQSKLIATFVPGTEVVFLATYAVDDLNKSILEFDQQLKAQGKTLENGVLLTTIDNRRYVQFTQKTVVPLPSGKTSPPAERPEDINGGWGKRYLMPGEPPNLIKLDFPENRKTNALPSSAEFMK